MDLKHEGWEVFSAFGFDITWEVCLPWVQCHSTSLGFPHNRFICCSDSSEMSMGKSILETTNSHTDQMDVDQEPAVYLEEEIIMKILSRLPVRSLHQCKCVSKFWNALISDPYFKMKHFKRAKNDRNSQKFLITLLFENESKFSSYCCPLSSSQMAEDAQKLVRPLSSELLFRVACACDGLVVVAVSDIMTDGHPMHLLWNPSIRESVVLPASEFEADEFTRYGFGYDSTSGDYKILRIWDESNQILALKVGSWRKINKHPHGVYNAVTRTHSLAFVREAFHWIGNSRERGSRHSSSIGYSLVSFCISKEMYGEIPLPEEILSLVGIVFVGVSVLDGMLCVHAVNRLRGLGDGELLFSCIHLPSDETVFGTSSGPFVSWPDAGYVGGVAYTESLIDGPAKKTSSSTR
ncbi:hypothetical protein BC332_29442 [Capsicum chinense]|nr:hypothetical protein BC332_29442 [Capsicum chinense]